MARRTGLMLVIFVTGTILGGISGILLFVRVVGGSGEPSVTISAPTLSLDLLQTPTVFDFAPMATQVAALATQVDALSTAAADDEILLMLSTQIDEIKIQTRNLLTQQPQQLIETSTRTPQPTRTPTLTYTPTLTLTPSPTSLPDQKLFRIVPEESEARFLVVEVLPPVTAVGSTRQIAGDIIVDFDQPANSRVGTIRINIRTLRTDEPARDGAIRSVILLSERPIYEFSDFIPTAITGLPAQITVGDTLNFQITGDFPLRGITRSVTFEVNVTIVSETEITGLAVATVLRSDYDLLDEGLVFHGVADEVRLEFAFVAREVEQDAAG
ncbi:MAG: YceI family protein [Anaerolineae bacterium]|nr:YceI family protein [Anaerolineae bacterium]